MDYEEAYKKALERARKIHNDTEFDYEKGMMEDIFPELAESEDERIRKCLLKYFENRGPNGIIWNKIGISRENILTWLEKQESVEEIVERCKTSWYNEGKIQGQIEGLTADEQYQQGWHDAIEKQGGKESSWKPTKEQYEALDYAYNRCSDTERGNYYEGVLKTLIEDLHRLEKQGTQNPIGKVEPKFKVGDVMRTLQEAADGMTGGMPVIISIDEEYYHCTNELIAIKDQDDYEYPAKNIRQKPIDKVEPKFHEGEWITNGRYNKLVVGINSDWPYYMFKDGTSKRIKDIDKKYHLWTIEDAKDGDVLAYVTDEEDLWIMIYWSLYAPYEGHVHYHALLVNDNFSDKGTCCICINDLKPATKEQRDLLFAKMHEAGYELDANKKELKLLITNGGDFV